MPWPRCSGLLSAQLCGQKSQAKILWECLETRPRRIICHFFYIPLTKPDGKAPPLPGERLENGEEKKDWAFAQRLPHYRVISGD
jgi:hypothetical protein